MSRSPYSRLEKGETMIQKAKAAPLMALLLAGTLVLSGCATAQSTAPATPQRAEPAGSGDPIPITHIAYQDYLGNYAFTPEGMYCSHQIYPASQSLFYLDAASRQELFLCAVPNCRHDSDTCSSYLPLTDAAYTYSLCYHNDALYLIQCATGDNVRPHIAKMMPDGSGLQELCTLEDGENFAGRLFGYGDSLLVELYTLSPDGHTTKQLEAINGTTGSRETLVTYPDGGRYIMMGAADNKLIFLCTDELGYQYFWVDPARPDLSLESCAREFPLTEVFDDQTLQYSIQGDYLCKVDQDRQEMSATNLVTGQVYEFDYPASDPNITWVGLQYLFDDRFALSCDEKNGDTVTTVCTVLDTDTGKPTDVHYTVTREQNRQILAVYGDQVLYKDHTAEVPLRNQTEYGLANEVTYVDVFRMADKDTFLQGLEGEIVTGPLD